MTTPRMPTRGTQKALQAHATPETGPNTSGTSGTLKRLQNIRQRLATLATIDLDAAAHGIDLELDNWEAAYYANTGLNGSSSSDISDPTHHSALRPKPADPNIRLNQLDQAANTIANLSVWLHALSIIGNPNPKERRTAASPCRGGTTHMPDDKGGCMAQGCTKRWPDCTPDTVPRFEECQGTIPAGDTRCTRCQLSIHHAICRDCLEVKELKQMRSTNWCNACRMRTERAS